MSSFSTDILVVGAGTTGLTLALQAHDLGANVRIVERRKQPFRHSRAMIIHPRTLEVLRPLGVTDALLARGASAFSIRLHFGEKEVRADLGELPLADTAFPYLLLEAQASVEEVLSEALASRGVEVERGCEVVELRRDSSRKYDNLGVTALLERTGSDFDITSRFVAGCDGPVNTVRRAAMIGWRGAPYRQEVILADVELEADFPPDEAHAVAARDGILFLFALSESATWRLLVTRPARGPRGAASQTGGAVPSEVLQTLIDRCGFNTRVTKVAWSAIVPLEHRIATSYRAGPIFLAGDAAHVHSPAGGQGMNTGIQDATNLGWKLALAASKKATDGSTESLLDSYDTERRPVARQVIALTHLLFWGEASTDRVASWVRTSLAPLAVPALPALLGKRQLVATAARIFSQLHISYRNSPLSIEGSPKGSHGNRPGKRLANETVIEDGHHISLHQMIAQPGVHILWERDAGSPTVGKPGSNIFYHHVESWAGQGVVVVRPDGYVGYRSGTVDILEIRRWLASIGITSV